MKRNVAVATISVLMLLYFVYFYVAGRDLDAGSLGTMGDFIGGNINPLLTFISTLLLIETLSLQRKATLAAEESAEDAKKTVQEQGVLIKTQIFESSLFNLLDLCLGEYKSSSIDVDGCVLSGAQAFGELERLFLLRKTNGEDPSEVLADLEDQYGDVIFSAVKSFSALFSFINDNAPEGRCEHYVTLVTKLVPISVLYGICIAWLHADWKILAAFEELGFFNKKGIVDLLDGYA